MDRHLDVSLDECLMATGVRFDILTNKTVVAKSRVCEYIPEFASPLQSQTSIQDSNSSCISPSQSACLFLCARLLPATGFRKEGSQDYVTNCWMPSVVISMIWNLDMDNFPMIFT